MNNLVDIRLELDEKCKDPKVTVRAKERTKLVDNIIQAVENVSEKHFPGIPAYEGGEIIMISQREIIRAQSHEHKVKVTTETGSYLVKNTLVALGETLDSERFVKISQSEIINLYKVKCFDLNIRGAIGIEFENGDKSWVSRRYLKFIRKKLGL